MFFPNGLSTVDDNDPLSLHEQGHPLDNTTHDNFMQHGQKEDSTGLHSLIVYNL